MEQNDLDVDMSQLEINERKRNFTGVFKNNPDEEDSPQSSPDINKNDTQPRRSSRKKIRPQEIEKRRVKTKPKKLLDSNSTDREINNYYLDKRVKRLPPSLETIFEEPKGNALMSARKFKRCIQFQIAPTKDKLKVKKRSMKAKKIGVVKRLTKSIIALDLLKKKLSSIEEDDDELDHQNLK